MDNSNFFQEGPCLGNQYDEDALLKAYLHWRLPKDVLNKIESDLYNFGAEVAGPIWTWAKQAERELPEHIPYDPWGRRVDELRLSDAWQKLGDVSATEGLVAIGFERHFGAFSRLYQFAKLYLFHPSSAFYTCPLAMADGAARVLEVYGPEDLKSKAFKALTSRDPQKFWTSGQWMTERTGGSDVGGTSTVAKKTAEAYELFGTKWFSSATTSQMALTLARLEGAEAGSRGLSLFYLDVRKPNGELNGIRINRLKDKLGTKALPTAELDLCGTSARMIGEPGQGVKTIATMLNITRLYNSICSLGQMRRALALIKEYSMKREAFGSILAKHPMHVETLAEESIHYTSGFVLSMFLIELLGKEEVGEASGEDKMLLRLLTPVAKLYTGKMSVRICSEVLESFGGAGYVEDTGLPLLLRDAQVFPIWEGATNVLSLDLLRVLQKPEAAIAFFERVKSMLSEIQLADLESSKKQVEQGLKSLELFFTQSKDLDSLQASARSLAQSMARVISASLMLSMAQWQVKNLGQRAPMLLMVKRFCSQDLAPLKINDTQYLQDSKELCFWR